VTSKGEYTKVVWKIIVFFDICSSTSILEDLLKTENQNRWRNLLIAIKNYLLQERSSKRFELYKFLGDGWILLFEPRAEGLEIFKFLENLSDKFIFLYKRRIKDFLTNRIPVAGLTFGMDIGSCIKVVMNKQIEYVGRPLNVAGRLQDAIGQRDNKPQNKGLVSKNLYATFKDKGKIKQEYTVWGVKRTLKNISGGEDYRCLKVELK
jgi:hypothetical protein